MSAYAACLDEIKTFLDTFAEADEVTVKIDDELIAALDGVLTGAAHLGATLAHLGSAAVAGAYFAD